MFKRRNIFFLGLGLNLMTNYTYIIIILPLCKHLKVQTFIDVHLFEYGFFSNKIIIAETVCKFMFSVNHCAWEYNIHSIVMFVSNKFHNAYKKEDVVY